MSNKLNDRMASVRSEIIAIQMLCQHELILSEDQDIEPQEKEQELEEKATA